MSLIGRLSLLRVVPLFIIVVATANVGTSQQVYYWPTEWYDNSGHIGDWSTNWSDGYIGGSFFATSHTPAMLFCNASSGIAKTQTFNGSQWSTSQCWSNSANPGWIGSWQMGTTDLFCTWGPPTSRFSYDNYLMTINNDTRWAMIQKFQGSGWVTPVLYTNNSSGYIGSWYMHTNPWYDQYVVGAFGLGGTAQPEILSIYPHTGYAMLQYLSGSNFVYAWDNPGGGLTHIGAWTTSTDSRYLVADFDGDGFDEILCIKPNWAVILKWNSGWQTLWSNNGNNYIGGWQIGSYDGQIALGFTSNGHQLLSIRSPWAMLQSYSSGSWANVWNNGGNGWVGSWQLGSDIGAAYPLVASSVNGRLMFMNANTHWSMVMRCDPQPLSVSISGPSSLGVGQQGTWYAIPAGGKPTYHYQWWYLYPSGGAMASTSAGARVVRPMRPPPNTWLMCGTDNPSMSRSDIQEFEVRCEVRDANSSDVFSNIIDVYVGLMAPQKAGAGATMAGDGQSIVFQSGPSAYELSEAYPNPFNPSTQIRFALVSTSNVSLTIYDVLGREVTTLLNGSINAGYHSVTWNGTNERGQEIGSGIYYARFNATDANGRILYSRTSKLLLMK